MNQLPLWPPFVGLALAALAYVAFRIEGRRVDRLIEKERREKGLRS